MSDVDGLVEFLRARLDEDHARADRMGHRDPTGEGGYYACPALRTEDESGDLPWGEANCDCGLALRKKRALAEVQAKRRIVMAGGFDRLHVSELQQGQLVAYTTVLRFLATPYADHPDYQPEWRP